MSVRKPTTPEEMGAIATVSRPIMTADGPWWFETEAPGSFSPRNIRASAHVLLPLREKVGEIAKSRLFYKLDSVEKEFGTSSSQYQTCRLFIVAADILFGSFGSFALHTTNTINECLLEVLDDVEIHIQLAQGLGILF